MSLTEILEMIIIEINVAVRYVVFEFKRVSGLKCGLFVIIRTAIGFFLGKETRELKESITHG